MPPSGLGVTTRLGVRREDLVSTPTWPGTAIAMTGLLPFNSHGVQETLVRQSYHTLEGAGIGEILSDVTARQVRGPLVIPVAYQGLETLWLAAMGFEAQTISAVTMPQLLATGVYRHLFELDDTLRDEAWNATQDGNTNANVKNRRFTLVADKGVSVWEHRSCLVSAWTLTVTPAEVTLALDLVGYDQNLASSVNTSGSLAALADQTVLRTLPVEATLRLGFFSTATALSTGDELNFETCTIHVDHHAGLDTQSLRTAPYIEAPERLQSPTVTGSVTFPRYQDNVALSRFGANILLMLTLVLDGPLLSGGFNYALRVYVPSLLLTSVPIEVGGAGIMRPRVDFTAFLPTSTPAGMPANRHGGPLMVELVNAISAHPLL